MGLTGLAVKLCSLKSLRASLGGACTDTACRTVSAGRYAEAYPATTLAAFLDSFLPHARADGRIVELCVGHRDHSSGLVSVVPII